MPQQKPHTFDAVSNDFSLAQNGIVSHMQTTSEEAPQFLPGIKNYNSVTQSASRPANWSSEKSRLCRLHRSEVTADTSDIWYYQHVKKNEMGGACGTYGGQETCIHGFGGRDCERERFEYLGVLGTIISKRIVEKQERTRGLGWWGDRQG